MIYVYTAIMNGWDNLRPPALDLFNLPGVRFICFTDNPVAPTVAPWEFRPLHPAGAACRTARVPKILPHLMLPDDCEYSIYHDGNLQLSADPRRIVEYLLADADWAAHRHPCRNCIYQEAEVLLRERIGTPELIEAEVRRYQVAGYPPGNGLWANGFLVRRHTEQVAALNEEWWRLYSAGGERDQLSFPVALDDFGGFRMKTIDADVYQSPYLNYHYHAAWTEQRTNIPFLPERERTRAKLSQLHALTGTVSTYPAY